MSAETRRFTFLQVSDSHLDSKALATAFPLTIAQRRMREAECLETLLRALSMAAERAVDAVLIPGDLWHNETVRASTVLKIIAAFDQLKGTPVIIAPGNRDCLSAVRFTRKICCVFESCRIGHPTCMFLGATLSLRLITRAEVTCRSREGLIFRMFRSPKEY